MNANYILSFINQIEGDSSHLKWVKKILGSKREGK